MDALPLVISALAWGIGAVVCGTYLCRECGYPVSRAHWLMRLTVCLGWPIFYVGGVLADGVAWAIGRRRDAQPQGGKET